MTSLRQDWGWISRIRLRAVSTTVTLAIVLLLGAVATQSGQAQTFADLYSFTGSNGEGPYAGLVRDTAGNLYGATSVGGSGQCGVLGMGCGTVFKLDRKGKETVLHSFTGPDGDSPNGVIRDASGNLYGTTYAGGSGQCNFGGCGTVFRLDVRGKETVLHSFTGGADGAFPFAGVVLDAKGNLYGTTFNGGDMSCGSDGLGCGVVFKLDTRGAETVLYSFTGGATDGCNPAGGLVRDNAGNLYGTTYGCGASDFGTVFKVDADGAQTVLHSFSGGTKDGREPYAGLVQDTDGNLYGTTVYGGGTGYGGYGCGTVFKVDTSGTETVLHSFSGTTDGCNPFAGVILDVKGNLYGDTQSLGPSKWGTVYELNMRKGVKGRGGRITLLHSFAGSDGAEPFGGVIRDARGNLYGTTSGGGSFGWGTAWKLTP
jgi:uncharacterized repeat protein (TIGR03803 family)